MDVAQIISTVVGSGGVIAALVAFYKARSTKQVGLSGVEVEDKAVTTADWTAWQEHWPAQIERLERRVERLEYNREEDADHIEALTAWIWAGKPPPPPERRRREPPPE